VLRDGKILGGDLFLVDGLLHISRKAPARKAHGKGDLVTNQHTPYRDSTARPVFAGGEVATGFSGTCRDDQSESLAPRW
jgi:hypothetical protein